MTQLLSRTGSRNQEFNQYDSAYEYQQYTMVTKDGNVYRSNDVIASGATFELGTTGATWELLIEGGSGSAGGASISNGTSNISIATLNGNITMAVNGSATQLEIGNKDISITDPLINVGNGQNVNYTRGHYFPTAVVDVVTAATLGELSGVTSIVVDATLTHAVTGDIITGPNIAANTIVVGISANSRVVNFDKPTTGDINIGDAITLTATKNRFIGYDTAHSQFAVATHIGVSNNKITGTTTYGNLKASHFIGDGITVANVANVYIPGGTSGQMLSTDGSGVLSWADGGSSSSIANENSNVNIATANGNITMSVNGSATQLEVGEKDISITDPLINVGNGQNVAYTRGLYFPMSDSLSLVTANATSAGSTTLYVTSDASTVNVGDSISGLNLPVNAVVTAVAPVPASTDWQIDFTPATTGIIPMGDPITSATPRTRFMGYDSAHSQFAVTINANVSNNKITNATYGNLRASYFIGDGLSVDDVANVSIAGGNNGEFLTTDGASGLSWTKASYGQLTTETVTATASQTSFVLSHTPSGTVVTSINGAVMKAAVTTLAGATLTYVPAQNSGYVLRAGDVLTFTYQYGVTTTTLLSGISGLNINNPAQGEVLTYDSATGKWINAASGSSSAYSLISNGTSRVQVTASGNVNTQIAGVANVTQVTTDGLTVNGKLDVSGDATITGNLSVLGTTTTNSAQGLVVVNPIIEEGGANVGSLTNDDGMDRGLLQNYYTTAPVKAFMGWKNSSGEFIFGSNVSNVNNVITVATYGNVRANAFNAVAVTASGNITANLFTGTLTTQAQPNITSLGNLNNLTSNGTVNFGNATNVSLGAVGNLHISGGSNGQVLRTDGSGTLSWMAISSSAITNGNSNVTVTANGNVGISSAGNANILIVTGTGANISGTANVTGNTALANVKVTGQANITANLIVGTFANIAGNINGDANLTITNDANIGGELLLTGNANVSGTIYGSGNVEFTGDSVSLGDIGNLHIDGGSNAQVLTTDGSGTLTWVTPTMSSLNSETFTATAGQTSFSLTDTPIGRVVMAVNGAEIIKTAVSVSGSTVTYASATNGGYDLEAGDTVQFSYVYGTPSATPATLGSITDVTATSPAQGQLLAYDTTAGKWVNNIAKASTSAVRGTAVTLGNLIAKVAPDGNNINVHIATALGTMTIVGSGTNVVGTTATSAAASQSLTTTFVSLASGWNLTTAGSTETWTIADTVTGNSWRITAIYTNGSGTASLTIERLN